MKTAAVVLGLTTALTAQATLSGLFMGATLAVNLVLVAVVYIALSFGAMTGLLAGTLGGLVQDAVAGGVIGIGGMSKTLIGFLVGVLGAQFNLTSTVPRLVMFAAATFVHELVFQGLQAIVGRPFTLKWSAVLLQSLINALIGVTAFLIAEQGPGAVQRRRMRRATLAKRRF